MPEAVRHFALKGDALEVKAGINPKGKNLRSYDSQFKPSRLVRTNLLNLKSDGKIFNLPLYAISILPILIAHPG